MSRLRLPGAAAAAAALTLALAAPVAAQTPGGGQPPADGEDGRVVDLPGRVVDLSHRQAALDGSQQRTDAPAATTVSFSADVLFEVDRSDLNAEARRRVDELATELDGLGGPRAVTIEGHTDDQGETAYNQRLSERRADAVRTRLAVILTDDRIELESTGFGESRPVAPNDTEGGRALNRRVVVSFPTD